MNSENALKVFIMESITVSLMNIISKGLIGRHVSKTKGIKTYYSSLIFKIIVNYEYILKDCVFLTRKNWRKMLSFTFLQFLTKAEVELHFARFWKLSWASLFPELHFSPILDESGRWASLCRILDVELSFTFPRASKRMLSFTFLRSWTKADVELHFLQFQEFNFSPTNFLEFLTWICFLAKSCCSPSLFFPHFWSAHNGHIQLPPAPTRCTEEVKAATLRLYFLKI